LVFQLYERPLPSGVFSISWPCAGSNGPITKVFIHITPFRPLQSPGKMPIACSRRLADVERSFPEERRPLSYRLRGEPRGPRLGAATGITYQMNFQVETFGAGNLPARARGKSSPTGPSAASCTTFSPTTALAVAPLGYVGRRKLRAGCLFLSTFHTFFRKRNTVVKNRKTLIEKK